MFGVIACLGSVHNFLQNLKAHLLRNMLFSMGMSPGGVFGLFFAVVAMVVDKGQQVLATASSCPSKPEAVVIFFHISKHPVSYLIPLLRLVLTVRKLTYVLL